MTDTTFVDKATVVPLTWIQDANTSIYRSGANIWCGTAGGTADAIVLTPPVAITAYFAGQTFSFIAAADNTTAVTVVVSGLAPVAVTNMLAGTVPSALVAGYIKSGALIRIQHDGTRFRMISPKTDADLWAGTAGGSANAIALTPTIAIPAYYTGQTFSFIAASDNTSAVTVAISGLTTKALTKMLAGTVSTALVAGDIVTGALIRIQYDGTRFRLVSSSAWLLEYANSINAKSYGGDEQLALNAATSNTVISPPTHIAMSSSITLADEKSLLGSGSMSSTNTYSGTSSAYILGQPSIGLANGIEFGRKRINISNAAGKGVLLIGSAGSFVHDLYIEGDPSQVGARSNVGIAVSANTNSGCFNNAFTNIRISHLKIGCHITDLGVIHSTNQLFSNFSFFGDSDPDAVGVMVESDCGDASMFVGGNIESCGTGFLMKAGALLISVEGMRFESVPITAQIEAGAAGIVFVNCHGMESIIDNTSMGAYIATIGCTKADGTPFEYTNIGSGPSVAWTASAIHNKTIVLSDSAGSTNILPAATGSGVRGMFVTAVDPVSGAIIIKVANSSDIIQGVIISCGPDDLTTRSWVAAPTNDTITLNRTTSGWRGKGEYIEVEDIATNLWFVRGVTVSDGVKITPFSSTVV